MRTLPSSTLLAALLLAVPVTGTGIPGLDLGLDLRLGAGVAAADDLDAVWSTDEVRLRARPGETASVVGRVDRGTRMMVVAHWGRWVRVRKGKRVGWVPRSQVEARRGAAPARQRDRTSGFSGKRVADALEVTVAIERVRGFDDPVSKAHCVLDLPRGATATAIGRGHDGWILIEHRGQIGWIPATAVTDGGRFARDPRGDSSDEVRVSVSDEVAEPEAAGIVEVEVVVDAREPRDASAPGRVAAELLAAVGGQTFAMRQTGGVDALATASGPSAVINAGARVRVGPLWIGGGAETGMGTASLVYATAGEQSVPMATRSLAVDAHASVGWGSSWTVDARAGYHYASLAVESERDEPMLLGEQVGGATVGLGGSMPFGDRISLALAVDVMPAGAQRPVELPPGVLYPTGARAAWAHGTLTVRLPSRIVAGLDYRGGVATADLTDGAPTPTTATRTDQSHTVSAGLGLRW